MRESFGGAFMIKLVLVFIVIYISFMAIAVNYARAFRIKNSVINILEQNQFSFARFNTDVRDKIEALPYKLPTNKGQFNSDIGDSCNNITSPGVYTNMGTLLTSNGVCVVAHNENNLVYYTVTTYISIELPLFEISLTLPISGETKAIVA